ncbi:hypothetical protein ATY41_08135 [Leifsonia xyli subsp. xyli]|uniref:Iron uptake ABC transporter, substrate-binding protein n=2 Tax=Leifsonia xyli subsp. xyli TaxID=59736 RepID=Q6AEH2_LEIXX|nr:extracellular solute-binding protein [Leifsonia xyli]AAT89224.1 iron uptake ABC transporter, substrate-binding protein [Leifsonia xyli subsp. xyli str. CTCB07]ODA90874.1 hypothetical protein ATY41_08135 [Leifsonia xyli subsp. xyli]
MKFVVRALTATAVAAAVAALAGCSATSPAPGSAEGSSAGTKLVVYTPQGDPVRGGYITKHAKSDLGLDVKLVNGAGGDLATRLIAEKNNPQADVVVVLGAPQLNRIDQAGVLQPFAPDWAGKIPSAFASGSKDFTLLTQTPIAIAYNASTMTAAQAPSSWTDLAKPEYKDKFAFPALTSQTGQAAAVGILWRYADHTTGTVSQKGWDTLAAILHNAKQTAAGAPFDWAQVRSGVQPIVVSWLGGIQTGTSDNTIDLRIVDAVGGSPFVNGGVGMVKDTKNAAAARKFIDWFGSDSFQVGFVTATKNDTPLNPDAVKRLPGAEQGLRQVTPQKIDWGVVSQRLSDWLQKIQLDVQG